MVNRTVYSTETSLFELLEKNSPSEFTRRSIDGHVVGSNKCVGYCLFEDHPGFLTNEQYRNHDCLKKNCCHFVPRSRKQPPQKANQDISPLILNHVQKSIPADAGIKIIKVAPCGPRRYSASYITVTNDHNPERYADAALKQFGVRISFVRLNYDFDVCVKLICGE